MKTKGKVVFNEYTQTYRYAPQNYWLASVKDGKLLFDSWDGMTKEIFKKKPHLKALIYLMEITRNLKI